MRCDAERSTGGEARYYLSFERAPRSEEVQEDPAEQIERLEHPAFIARFGRSDQVDGICGRDNPAHPDTPRVGQRLTDEVCPDDRSHSAAADPRRIITPSLRPDLIATATSDSVQSKCKNPSGTDRVGFFRDVSRIVI